MDDRALHQRITADIEDKIRSGVWPPGFRIPFEHELTAQYGCARATVNKAVSVLAAAGLIERRRRAGSFVARPHIQSAVLQIPDIEAAVSRRGQTYGYELISRDLRRFDPADAEEARMGDAPGLEIRCLHFADGRPLAFEHRILNLDASPQAEAADFSVISPGAWLLQHVAWTEGEHRISAINPKPAEARLLKIRPAEACLCVRRWTWRGGEGITFVRQIFPGDAYDLVARFTPTAA